MANTRITIEESVVPAGIISASNMSMGDVGIIVRKKNDGANFAGQYLLKCYGKLVLLNDPSKTWSIEDQADLFEVRIAREVTINVRL